MVTDTNMVVLLVEDSGSMRRMEKKILSSLGYENVIEAENGKAATGILKGGQQVDLIISDWNMPEMDGYELLKWVRSSEAHKAVPFLMATAQVEKSQVAKANEAGVSALISKPFTGEELQLKIDGVMNPGGEHAAGGPGRRVPQVKDGRLQLKMAHIQITDHLVLGVAKHRIESGQYSPSYFDLTTERMAGWNPVQAALEEGSVDGAFVLAPIAMDLFAYETPIKLVMLAHKNGSIMVRSAKGDYQAPGTGFFRDSAFYIPHLLSVHHMLAHKFFNQIGLKAGVAGEGEIDVRFEVVPPIKMPELLANSGNASGYLVAEPLGSKAVAAGIAQRQFLSGEVWPGHPCCVAVFRDEVIEAHRDAVQEFCGLMAESGQFIASQPADAAEVGVKFLDPEGKLGLKSQVLNKVLTEPSGITTGDLYPVKDSLDAMQQYMSGTMGFGKIIDLDAFVDTSFADEACRKAPSTKPVAAAPAPTAEYGPDSVLLVGGLAGAQAGLESAGLNKLVSCGSAAQAREMLKKGPCKLVLADWDAGGLELLQWIRAGEATANLPFIMAVDPADKMAVLQSIKAKANNYVNKPFNPEDLAAKLGKVIGE
jgi:CheY-like chemotaxis protein